MWKEISPAVYRRLRRKGASHNDAEDITQEVALKVIAKGVSFTDADDLARFAHHAARCLRLDRLASHAASRTDLKADVEPVAMHTDDVVDSITARVAWGRLRSGDREVLLRADEPGNQAEYRKRSRARQRLAMVLASLQVWWLWLWRKLRTIPGKRVGVTATAVALTLSLALAVQPPLDPRPDAMPEVKVETVPSSSPSTSSTLAVSAPLSNPTSTSPTTADYQERITVPKTQIVIGPADNEWIVGGTRPTKADDGLVCLHRLPLIGTRCISEAPAPLRGLFPK